jgi:hypothetical protein
MSIDDNDFTKTLVQYGNLIGGFDGAFADGFGGGLNTNAHPVPVGERERIMREATLAAFREALLKARADPNPPDNEAEHVYTKYQRNIAEFYEQGVARWIIEQGVSEPKPSPYDQFVSVYAQMKRDMAFTREKIAGETLDLIRSRKTFVPVVAECDGTTIKFRRYKPARDV